MKNVKLLTRLLFVAILFTACSNDDDAPTPVNEEEVITTLTVKLIPSGGGSEISMIYRDLDGPDGPNDPVITTTSDLATGIASAVGSAVGTLTSSVASLVVSLPFFFCFFGTLG